MSHVANSNEPGPPRNGNALDTTEVCQMDRDTLVDRTLFADAFEILAGSNEFREVMTTYRERMLRFFFETVLDCM